MNPKMLLEVLGVGFCIFYIIVTLIINSTERAAVNQLPSDIDMDDISSSSYGALSNLMEGPVVNLRVLVDGGGEQCSGEIPTLYTWRSVDKYCQCATSVTRKSCSRYSLCRNVSRRAFSFHNWKGIKFCLDKLKKEDWKFAVEGSFPCPDGFRLCKGGICVGKSILECPITDLIVSDTKPNTTEGNYLNVSRFLGEKYIFISRDANKSPLVNMRVGIPSIPCINNRIHPLRTTKNSYPITEIQPVGCDKEGNYGADHLSHKEIDTDYEWNFYDTVSNYYFSQLPGFRSFVGNEGAVLFSRSKIEFQPNKHACLTFDYQSLKDVANDLNTFESLRLGCNICSFVFCSLVILATMIFCCMQGCCKLNKNDSPILRLGLMIIIIALINAIILVILCAIAISYMNAIDSNTTLMNELAENDCFKHEGYNTLFNNLQHYLLLSFPSGKAYNTANLVLSGIYLVVGLISCILMTIFVVTKSYSSYSEF